MKKIIISTYNSPAGDLTIGSFGDRLCLCDWVNGRRRDLIGRQTERHLGAKYEDGTSPVIEHAIRQLDEYFNGTRRVFDIPLELTGTEFQRNVRLELLNIPYGNFISYAELARRIGNPKAVRAVASANAANPISIFIPCHRVIGSDNRLTGYGGGLSVKKYLLELEGAWNKEGIATLQLAVNSRSNL